MSGGDAATGHSDGERRPFLYRGRTAAEWVPVVVERIAERFDPLRIVLFGSHARGEPGPDSDIDLLVVFAHVEDKHSLAVKMRLALADLPPPVDLIPTDPDEIARRGDLVGTVLGPALREGVVVYERP